MFFISDRNIFWKRHPSVRPSGSPSVTLSPPELLGRIILNLLNHSPLMVRVCESNVIFSVHSSVRLPSVHLSVMLSPLKPMGGIKPNLLHHFPRGKGVREQYSFSARPSVRPSIRHLHIRHAPPKPLGGIQPNLLHPFLSW